MGTTRRKFITRAVAAATFPGRGLPARATGSEDEEYVWVETETFDDLGGWTLDTQFIESVGSAYLLAAGILEPVADASTTVSVRRSGQYTAWVHTKNWVSEHSPGRFRLLINGESCPEDLGTLQEPGWAWQRAGRFHLRGGHNTIALHDLTGQYGRCSVILLTTDRTFEPPSDKAGIRAMRARLADLAPEPADLGAYEFIVVGGGVGGCAAAIEAARLGLRVALIHNRPLLGGNASDEIRVGVEGAAEAGRSGQARESGLVEEMRLQAQVMGGWSTCLEALTEAEPKLSVFLDTEVTGVREGSDPRHIAAVEAVHTVTGESYVATAPLFADCTGDGDVGYAAGAEFRVGRESRGEYNELMAPEQGDRGTMGTSLLHTAVDTGAPVPFEPPEWAYRFPTCDDLPHRDHTGPGPFWWIEWGGEVGIIEHEEEIRDNLLRVLYGVFDHIKNHCPLNGDRLRNHKLTQVGTVGGKRESRRLMGDYVLTEHDVRQGTLFPDRVAYGGWPIDIHPPGGIFSPEPPCTHEFIEPCSIPFRCLYSRSIDNLLMAGRLLSATHVALGVVRVMATIGTMGQAIGAAAALCRRYDVEPRALATERIEELQQLLLRRDAFIIGLRNQDGNDLARRASVTASSTMPQRTFRPDDVQLDREPPSPHELDGHFRAQMYSRTLDHLAAANLYLRNTGPRPREAVLHLRVADSPGDFSGTEDVAVARAEVPPGESWVRFELHAALPKSRFFWIMVERARGLAWFLMTEGPVGATRAYSPDGRQWTPRSEFYACTTEPLLVEPASYNPEQVLSGQTRVWGTEQNLWASDPNEPLPQWLELTWPDPVALDTVQVTFDTNLYPRYPEVPVPQTVRSYEIAAKIGADWQVLAREDDNHLRWRVHTFEPVTTDALRLTVLATHGSPSARVFEVRAYHEAS